MGTFNRFSVARELLQRGDVEQALAEVDRVVGLFGTSLEALELQVEIREAIVAKTRTPEQEAQIWFEQLRSKAVNCNNSSQYEKALELIEEVLVQNPQDGHAWLVKGFALDGSGQYEEAIAAFDLALSCQNPFYPAWFNRGRSLDSLCQYESAIASYDQALQIKPDDHQAWNNRGDSLAKLGRYEAAIASSDQALQIKPDDHQAWHNRGLSLEDLGQYEAAIASYDQALQIKPDNYAAWSNRGSSLEDLGQYEAAIASYDQALQIKPDSYQMWHNRGTILGKSGQYEAAIVSYGQALKIKPDSHQTWNGRGVSLERLRQYEAAIASYDQALQIKPDYHEAWHNRSVAAFSSSGKGQPNAYTLKHPTLNDRGYPGELASLTVGLTHCPDPFAQGFLQRRLGDAHWNHARTQASPRPYWREALKAYNTSLHSLTAADHPEERLQTLQKLIRTHDALREIAPDAMQALLRQGTELRTRILTQARSDEQRERLTRSLPNFNELTVDFHLSQGDNILALETAEADKNGLMQWLLTVPGTANYAQMREMIGVDTAIVYWYLGANAITTFVLRADQVEPIVVTEFDREISLKMRDRLDEWIKKWNKKYTVHRQKSKESNINENSDWQNTLPTELESLAKILNIPALLPHLQNIQNLILVPHRDLHRFPLHTFFPKNNITYLPSLHLGRHLRPASTLTQNLLNVVAPAHNEQEPLPDAAIESHALDRMCQTRQIPTTTLENATHQTLTQALPNPHNILHFNGHAGYNDTNPKLSSLGLQNDDTLTTIDLTKLPALSHYNLITLTSCETAITGNQTITSEYVGLISGFLGHGIPHILSTLWTIESAASALFILQFYRQILKGKSPAQALAYSQTWMRIVTKRQLHRHYTYWIDRLLGNDRIRAFLKTARANLGTMEADQKPYSHPYYWAAFILSGRG